jgi:hypothetical protein
VAEAVAQFAAPRVCVEERADAAPVAVAVAVAGAGAWAVAVAGSGATAAGSWDRAVSPATAPGDQPGRSHEAAAACRPQQECTSTASYCSQFRWPAASA